MKFSSRLLCSLFIFSPFIAAQEALSEIDLDLDVLMSMDVQATSAMKRAQSAFDTPSSIYVLSKEQINNSGVTSIPDALKMVPGLIVRQLDNNQWAISSRGVASRFSSKLLVMIDGQSLYTPKFSAVYWETLNVPIYDVERIEVIRGQGGLLWGSNANNGVINIITKNSLDSRGSYARAVTGTQINNDISVRYGDDISNKGSYRIYGHQKNIDESTKGLTSTPIDTAKQQSAGARVDFNMSDDWSGLAQGDVTYSELGQNYRGVIDESNHNISLSDKLTRTDLRVMARIENQLSSTANQMLQASLLKQHGSQMYIKENFKSIDIDYQMNFIYGSTQLDWGLNYRYNSISYEQSTFLSSDQNLNTLHQYGGFIQGQFTVIPDELSLIAGIKTEHNDLTGLENQPLIKLTYKPMSNQITWASISKSVRIPTLIEYNDNFTIDGTKVKNISDGYRTDIPEIDHYRIKTFLNGNSDVKSESYVSYEAGYRFTDEQWSLDFSLFHTDADDVAVIKINSHLEQFVPADTLLQTGNVEQALLALTDTQIDFDIVSTAKTETKGFDILLTWQPSENISTELGYSYTTFSYNLPFGTFPTVGYDSKNRQTFVKANFDITKSHNLFTTLRVENSDAYNTPNYTMLDVTWNWHINPNWAIALTGKNLFASPHLEYNNEQETYTLPNYIDESVAFNVIATF